MRTPRVVIVGATSALAQATARRFADRGCAIALIGRDRDKLRAVASDLDVRGAAEIHTLVHDLGDLDGLTEAMRLACEAVGPVDAALVAHGTLPDRDRAERDPAYLVEHISLNATSTITVASILGEYFRSQGHGCLCVITSVAGDRARASNYQYGAAKGAVSQFLGGLRARLRGSGVAVVDIRPGPVATPMMAHRPRGLLTADPERVAAAIDRAMRGRRAVVYVPFFWRPIMFVIRHLPRVIFERLKF